MPRKTLLKQNTKDGSVGPHECLHAKLAEFTDMNHVDLRNFKDFLQLYNQMSELCFNRCVYTFGGRDLTDEEARCAEVCASKHVKINHKSMSVYMEVQPIIVNKRIEEMNEAQRTLEREAEEKQSAEKNSSTQQSVETETKSNIK